MTLPRQLLRPAQFHVRTLIQTSFQPTRSTIISRLQTPDAVPIMQIRRAGWKSSHRDKGKDPRVQTHVVDEQIGSLYINLVQDDGTFLPAQPLRDVLRDMDRISNFLLRLSPAQSDHEHPYPICRIVSKDEVRSMEREKIKKKKTWDDLTKMVEINWSIAKNDLEHQMKRMTQFLEQGLRVEVVLGPKKRGRKATPEEIQNVLARIKETVASIPNVKEYAESEGEVGRVLSMHFSKPKEQVQKKMEEEEEAAAPNKEAEAEDKSKLPKKVSRYKIKEEEKRKQMMEKAEAAKYMDILDAQATQSRPEEVRPYDRVMRLMREEKQRREEPRRAEGDSHPSQPPATPARRPLLGVDSQDFGGQRLGGRTGSFSSAQLGTRSSR